ncbi:CDGSH iron-sulfur domain-containing protein [Clostridium psychrophilum]|uniref:CDGSH iron-sulfur domain-containing protein n=1 Tax=Clostridium psychrophilum TaxID=132926 RepID=UPI001C0C3ADC|nr:CDGSH iron-sulfur domain-containing protein [Clostridium psychrophilum]MBU3180181.1 CDGSH iron-sulfur domain-containing protein [Clostridium psychrophilum]
MEIPKIAKKAPITIQVKKGETYYWCACGRSSNQPFCDGSHKVTAFKPLEFTAGKDDTVYICQCKQTETPPFCDCTHRDF